MLFPFLEKKYCLLDRQVFNGYVDWHSHILPGVDDGIHTMQDALDVLSYYEQIGIKEVWLTPHILEDMPNTTANLRQRFWELNASYSGSIQLHLAAENMICNLFQQRLASNDVLPIGERQDHLLIEFSCLQPPVGVISTIKKIQDKGYMPILAHPERYGYMEISDYELLKREGCKLQLNMMSLVGYYGNSVMNKAQKILSLGLYDISGSDLHDLGHFRNGIAEKKLKKDIVDHIKTLSHRVL